MNLRLLSIAPLLFLTACSTSSDMFGQDHKNHTSDVYIASSQAQQVLSAASNCCLKFNQINFETIEADSRTYLSFDRTSQALELSTGKSFVQGLEIANQNEDIYLEVDAYIADTAFLPYVLVLNKDFEQVQLFDHGRFTYQEASMTAPDRLSAILKINGGLVDPKYQARYVVVFSPQSAFEETIEVTHPARQFAQAQNRADPNLDNPIIPFSAMGLVSVKASLEPPLKINSTKAWWGSGKNNSEKSSNASKLDKILIVGTTQTQPEAAVSLEPIVAPEPVAETAAVAAVTASAVAATVSSEATSDIEMQDETEQFYNQMIEDAVKRDDIDKALRLLDEAERVGSSSARQTFIKAVNKG